MTDQAFVVPLQSIIRLQVNINNLNILIDNFILQIQSPSLESFSTIQDIENLSELNMDENSDLSVKIDHPQKHLETLETYITFRITTKVARIEYSDNEYIVRRRYNDFIWLRQKLIDCHPFCIIPVIILILLSLFAHDWYIFSLCLENTHLLDSQIDIQKISF